MRTDRGDAVYALCATPDEVYRTASGGGARIVDQFGKTEHTRPETQKETELRGNAVLLHVNGYPLSLTA